MDDIATTLLSDIEDYLNITWQDEATDKKIKGYINRGMKRLQEIAGASLDFTEEDQPRALLFDYCRYANSQALEMFEKNFQSELIELNFTSQYNSIPKLTIISAPGISSGYTALEVSPGITEGNSYFYNTGETVLLPALNNLCAADGFLPWDGESDIEARNGWEIVIAEANNNGAVIKAGKTIVSTLSPRAILELEAAYYEDTNAY